MTLIGSILKKVLSSDSLQKYPSPPPEPLQHFKPRKRKRRFLYSHIGPKVDSKPPNLCIAQKVKKLHRFVARHEEIHKQNLALLTEIKRMHFTRGRVDCQWRKNEKPKPVTLYYENRMHFHKQVFEKNQHIYQCLVNVVPRVNTTKFLREEWKRLRTEILIHADKKFVLFEPEPKETIEDPAFVAAKDFKRPRAWMWLRVRDGAELGRIQVELFTDCCPQTCELFLQLLDGDPSGFGYVGTTFFRKAAGLFWSGGDVVYNNGFGCFAQRGRTVPIGAENYHYSHSMPGLLTMRVTKDNEMCGIFSIIFKPLPQLDLKSVVFGRVVRPCPTYEVMSRIGSVLSPAPRVLLSAARRRDRGLVIHGKTNTRVIDF